MIVYLRAILLVSVSLATKWDDNRVVERHLGGSLVEHPPLDLGVVGSNTQSGSTVSGEFA